MPVGKRANSMGAFIGYGDIGVWANNRERDAFLDWFADHRCAIGDARWVYCKSEAQRWTGRCIELEDLLPKSNVFSITDVEYNDAATTFWPHVAQLLGIIESITRGEWRIRIDSGDAIDWRRPRQGL
jgi:hypothetical protein